MVKRKALKSGTTGKGIERKGIGGSSTEKVEIYIPKGDIQSLVAT